MPRRSARPSIITTKSGFSALSMSRADARPVIGLAALLGADQAGIGARLAQDADLGRLGEGFLQPVGEPVGHRVAEHHDVAVGATSGRRAAGAREESTGACWRWLVLAQRRIPRCCSTAAAAAAADSAAADLPETESGRRAPARRPGGATATTPSRHLGKAEQRQASHIARGRISASARAPKRREPSAGTPSAISARKNVNLKIVTGLQTAVSGSATAPESPRRQSRPG